MKVAIMQPYFFPYIGYFQLINSVDNFVIYDNIEFTKKGWINRNRILVNGTDKFISLPIKKDSDYLHVKDRKLSSIWEFERKKMLNRIFESYKKAPCFEDIYEMIKSCIMYEDTNLFNFILHSLKTVLNYLNIKNNIIVSSTLPVDHGLKNEQKVITLCKHLHADIYINPIGGIDLYSKEKFQLNNLELQFQKSSSISYAQFGNTFIPGLSIIDVMMFNKKEDINIHLNSYSLF